MVYFIFVKDLLIPTGKDWLLLPVGGNFSQPLTKLEQFPLIQ
jgi:hypothetical protein